MQSLPIPVLPWQIVSQDIFDYHQNPYLVTVCHFSDWIEVDPLQNTLSPTVIDHTKAQFARYGVPQICHTDNGPQFISKDYKAFSKEYGFRHTLSSPYYPKGNGRAEAAVKVAKNILKKSDDFHAGLLNYRNTPQQGHHYSPVQRMMNHRTRTLVPTSNTLLAPVLVNTEIVSDDISQKRRAAKLNYDRNTGDSHSLLEPGSYCYVKPPPTKKGSAWSYGEIMSRDQNRSYTISTPTSVLRRNRIHIRQAAPPTTPAIYKYVTMNPVNPPIQPSLPLPEVVDISTDDSTELLEQAEFRDDAAENMGVTEHIIPSPIQTLPIQRPIRERKRPKKYDDYVL